MTKDEARRALRRRRAALTPEYIESASARIVESLTGAGEYNSAGSIFIYVSLPDEPQTAGIIAHALAAGKRVYVPRCVSPGVMEAVEISSPDELSPGAFGIQEPPRGAPPISPGEIELAVVPCLACGQDMRRIGHGAGYYDRFLRRTGAKRYAMCFEALITDGLPVDGQDVRMDAVVSEKKVYTLKDKGEN